MFTTFLLGEMAERTRLGDALRFGNERQANGLRELGGDGRWIGQSALVVRPVESGSKSG